MGALGDRIRRAHSLCGTAHCRPSEVDRFVVYTVCFVYIPYTPITRPFQRYFPSLMIYIPTFVRPLVPALPLIVGLLLVGCGQESSPDQRPNEEALPNRAQMYEERGDQFLRAGRYREAIRAYRRVAQQLGATAE